MKEQYIQDENEEIQKKRYRSVDGNEDRNFQDFESRSKMFVNKKKENIEKL